MRGGVTRNAPPRARRAPGPADASPPPRLRRDEIELLLATARGAPGALAARNHALLAVLCLVGLRSAEALSLTTADVLVDRAELLVRQGDSPRTLHLPPRCLDALDTWLSRRRCAADDRRGARDDHLFVTRTGSILSAQHLRDLLRRLGRRAGVRTPVSPEMLRRSHAEDLLRRGWPLREIQLHLGYKSPSATRRYLRAAGLALPGDADRESLPSDVLLRRAGPCRTCFHGDALDDEPFDGMDDSLDAVIVLDAEGRILRANRTAGLYFDSDSAGLSGRSIWDVLAGDRHAWVAAACREGLQTRRPAWAIPESPLSNGATLLLRVIPTGPGLALWIRDELALGGMSVLAERFSRLAHGSAEGVTMILRGVRDDAMEVVDFAVAAIHGPATQLVAVSPDRAVGRRISTVFSHPILSALMSHSRHALDESAGHRFVLAADGGATTKPLAVRIVPLAGDWLAVAIQAAPT